VPNHPCVLGQASIQSTFHLALSYFPEQPRVRSLACLAAQDSSESDISHSPLVVESSLLLLLLAWSVVFAGETCFAVAESWWHLERFLDFSGKCFAAACGLVLLAQLSSLETRFLYCAIRCILRRLLAVRPVRERLQPNFEPNSK